MSGDQEFSERLTRARVSAGFKSPREAAQRFGWNENTYKAREGGFRGIPKNQDVIRTYARAFKVQFLWLLTGKGDMNSDPDVADGSDRFIPIVGKIGADASIDVVKLFGEAGEGYAFDYSAPLPPNFKPSTRALEVEGDSMRNIARDGWLIYYNDDEVQEPPTDDLYDELCICWLEDRRVLFKILQPGMGDGFYDLESSNADTIRDVIVRKAVRVAFIAPRGRRPNSDKLAAEMELRNRRRGSSAAA